MANFFGLTGITVLKSLIAIFLGIIEGNASVHIFNRIPVRWLTDYKEEPHPELLDASSQRVKSYPWKFIFSMLFILINIKLVGESVGFAFGTSLLLWLLLEISIGDTKYQIIPDEFNILVAVTTIGFLPFYDRWLDPLYGGLVGILLILISHYISKLIFKKNAFGGGDIKLFACLGLVLGPIGIVFVFAVSILLSSVFGIYFLIRNSFYNRDNFEDKNSFFGHFNRQGNSPHNNTYNKKIEYLPFAPYIAVSTALYLLFFYYLSEGIVL